MKIERISRQVIDAWSIENSGLPARVAHCALRNKAQTIGDIRDWPDEKWCAMRHFGVISLEALHRHFELFDRLEKGTVQVSNLQEVFNTFLSPWESEILADRFGLSTRPGETDPAEAAVTLQSIANRTGHTRERIRQVQEDAIITLSSPCAQLFLQPFCDYFEKKLNGKPLGTCRTAELDAVAAHEFLSAYRPAGVIEVLSEIGVCAFKKKKNLYSCLPDAVLQDLQDHAGKTLARSSKPLTLADVVKTFPVTKRQSIDEKRLLKALRLLLENNPNVGIRKDGSYFLFETATTEWLTSYLRKAGKPASLSDIVKAFNRQLAPSCHKGVGFIRRHLGTPPITAGGIRLYTCKPDRRKRG